MQHRKGDAAGLEGLRGQVEQDGRILAATKEQHGALGLGGDLADDEDGQRLQEVQVTQRVSARPDQGSHRRAGSTRGRP